MLIVITWVAFLFSSVGADLELIAADLEQSPEPRRLKDLDALKCLEKTFCCFVGNVLPLFPDFEKDVPNIIRLIMYLMGLLYTFLGIGIISDVFMTGIEKVTSRKIRTPVKGQPGKYRTSYLWNATVANLTLMALGSSAPEILLSLIEISMNDMFLGDLGAGTIVGSAAFNLLCISAVCVCAIDDGEVRKIDQTKVYIVTAFFSVFAYLWLMFILMVTTPDVCTIGEALVTLLFTPLFVFLAYLADRGYFEFNSLRSPIDKLTYQPQKDGEQSGCLADDVTDEELREIEERIRSNHGNNLTDDQVAEIMRLQYLPKRSRAYYLHLATEAKLHGKKEMQKELSATNSLQAITLSQTAVAFDAIDKDKQSLRVSIEFAIERYVYAENCGTAKLVVIRRGCDTVKASVAYATREGTAKAGEDYEHVSNGYLVFEKNETAKTLEIKIKDDEAFEQNEEFYVDLSQPRCEENTSYEAALGETKTATVVVIDDDQPGQLRFKSEHIDIAQDDQSKSIRLVVERFAGNRGKISCKWKTEDHSAKAELDYKADEGEIVFENNEMAQVIDIELMHRVRIGEAAFHVILTDPDNTAFDPETDGGAETCICTVNYIPTESKGDALTKMKDKITSVNNTMGHRKWYEQFIAAIFDVGEEDDDEISCFDKFMHVITIPWKLLFACCPPPDYCGGWACFFGALLMIALVTAIVGDLANLVGCCMGIKGEITAITFVALGTSLPDTFASKAAAQMDPYADASIGNITGSNSVNVFMGIGLSWLLGAIFWQVGDPTAKWWEQFKGYDSSVQKNILDAAGCVVNVASSGGYKCDSAVFMAPAGSIWFNLMVFSVNAMLAIGILAERRKVWGGELGGPKNWSAFLGQYQTAAFLVFQWFIYIIASSVYATVKGEDSGQNFSKFFFN